MLTCVAADIMEPRLKALASRIQQQTRPALLMVLNTEKLTPPQQALLENWIAGGALTAGSHPARVLFFAETSLTALADTGEFNEMLLMRAGAKQLTIPALHGRREDLPQIARAVLWRLGTRGLKFAPAATEWLQSSTWPGDYLQFHRMIEIAHSEHPKASVLDVPDLERATEREPEWRKPLYPQTLMTQLEKL
jgi:DNA-binding NtrC family response regulator